MVGLLKMEKEDEIACYSGVDNLTQHLGFRHHFAMIRIHVHDWFLKTRNSKLETDSGLRGIRTPSLPHAKRALCC